MRSVKHTGKCFQGGSSCDGVTSTPNIADVVSLRLPSITVKWWLCTVYRRTCVCVCPCVCVPAGRWPVMLLFSPPAIFFPWFTLYHPSIISLYLYIISVSLHAPRSTLHHLSMEQTSQSQSAVSKLVLDTFYFFERTVSPRRKTAKRSQTSHNDSRNDLMYHTIFIMLEAISFFAFLSF